jgi:hypothetical protein
MALLDIAGLENDHNTTRLGLPYFEAAPVLLIVPQVRPEESSHRIDFDTEMLLMTLRDGKWACGAVLLPSPADSSAGSLQPFASE